MKTQSVTINTGDILLKAGHHGDKKKDISKTEPDDKGNAIDFQRDADISTLISLDQAWHSHSPTFHLKSWPQEINE